MPELADAVTMKGNPVTLQGNQVEVGQKAPDCTLVANDLSEVTISSFAGKKVMLSIVPSLDTPVCDAQTRKFNEEVAKLGDDVALVTISMDLPFAQKRWCGAAGLENAVTLSDHRDGSFGEAYGLIVKGVRLLARAIIILDASGEIKYKELVGEITNEPNYDAALEALKNV